MSQSKTIAAREAALVKAQSALAKAHESLDLAAAKAAVKEAVVVKASKKATAPIRAPTANMQRWRSFQKFIWQQMKVVSVAVSYKEAMKEAGHRWENGQPISTKDKLAFEAFLDSSEPSSPNPSSEDEGEEEPAAAPAASAAPAPVADPVLAARLAAIAWRDAEIAQLEARIAILRATPI
jgi:hypothetical protein